MTLFWQMLGWLLGIPRCLNSADSQYQCERCHPRNNHVH